MNSSAAALKDELKSRDPRRPVLLKGEIGCDGRWNDAAVLNLSSRGMLIFASGLPDRGTYLEVRLGAYTLVCRVAWRSGQRAGLTAQGKIPLEVLMCKGRGSVAPSERADAVEPAVAADWRRLTPAAAELERSRWKSSMAQFVWFVLSAGMAAIVLFALIEKTLAIELLTVSEVLSRAGGR